ncbi:hypothetical protein AQUCO_02000066v1 [Aquilegia coerulea]|uniref:Uncharacterized protein n=1 Tax=Aquilegia coerulea TaxID=218851 RepID=A0A2G5DFT3_AQUCA|nr:hypothetical protein AQUCO_02000066v1 [Aquilegia coerulea]
MSIEETRIVKQILNMQIKHRKEEMADAFAELCYIDVQNFEVTGLIPIELREGILYFPLSVLQNQGAARK